MNKTLLTVAGFLLFTFGFLSLVLSMIGVQLAFLAWLDKIGALFAFIIRILMVLAGIILVALAQTNWARERAESR
jgi:energy-converting hydrogenase Eha subunit E